MCQSLGPCLTNDERLCASRGQRLAQTDTVVLDTARVSHVDGSMCQSADATGTRAGTDVPVSGRV